MVGIEPFAWLLIAVGVGVWAALGNDWLLWAAAGLLLGLIIRRA